MSDLFSQQTYVQPGDLVAGVDEVGRGPLIGAVVAAACILPPDYDLPGLNDSKKLTAIRREQLSVQIREQAIAWHIAQASAAEIDQINILQASLLAMHRAVEALQPQPDFVLVDGNRLPQWPYVAKAVVGGDGKEVSIAAASILAKVHRDAMMVELAEQFPQYGFEKHKGYPTKQHMLALQEHGVLPEHRRSFGPVKKMLASDR